MIDSAQIREHMDVISSDRKMVGKVDHLDGPDRIRLTRQSSPNGDHHHVIPLAWVDHVDPGSTMSTGTSISTRPAPRSPRSGGTNRARCAGCVLRHVARQQDVDGRDRVGHDGLRAAKGRAPIVWKRGRPAPADRSLKMTTVISGIAIPDSRLAREAAELVRSHESEMLFNHSVRVYVFGALKGQRQKLKFDPELLYVAALFHDLGLADHYHSDNRRFEVDGADAARAFLRGHGIAEAEADLVWEAVALHTTPGIPQFMRPEIALTNAGVLVDVVGVGYDEYTAEQRDQVIAALPRGDFKNEFVEVQTCSAMKKPQTTFGTVNFDFIEHRDPAFRKPNACTRIRNTPWSS
jgi:hypothetical protein